MLGGAEYPKLGAVFLLDNRWLYWTDGFGLLNCWCCCWGKPNKLLKVGTTLVIGALDPISKILCCGAVLIKGGLTGCMYKLLDGCPNISSIVSGGGCFTWGCETWLVREFAGTVEDDGITLEVFDVVLIP